MQGEAYVVWGNDQVLWLAVIGVVIMRDYFVRLGLAHFATWISARPWFDSLNLRWCGRHSVIVFSAKPSLYPAGTGHEVSKCCSARSSNANNGGVCCHGLLGKLSLGELCEHTGKMLSRASMDDIKGLVKMPEQNDRFSTGNQHLSAVFIFTNNIRATLLILLEESIHCSVLGMIAYLINVACRRSFGGI